MLDAACDFCRRGLPALAVLVAGCVGAPRNDPSADLGINVLGVVRSWAIQLQELESSPSQRALETATVDMLVVEPMRSQRGLSDFAMADLIRRLQKSPGETLPRKRVLAYLNVGQAEDYRDYWTAEWQAPTAAAVGRPAFLLGLDPDGWQGNYPVAYWDPAWRRCLWGSPGAQLDQILADGFDGVYLDWVLGFADANVVAAAAAQGVDPRAAMVDLIRELRAYARARYPLFAVVAQNGLALAETAPELLQSVDALSQEDVSFRGTAAASWFEPAAGDVPAPPAGEWSTERLLARLRTVAEAGMPVFTLDYALLPANVEAALRRSRSHGFVPCVSRTPLDRLPPHAQPSR